MQIMQPPLFDVEAFIALEENDRVLMVLRPGCKKLLGCKTYSISNQSQRIIPNTGESDPSPLSFTPSQILDFMG